MEGHINKGIIGRKRGMTQIFDDEGKLVPVTLLEAGPCIIVQKKTEDKDGYRAVQLGFEDAKPDKITKAEQGHFKNKGLPPKKVIRELRVEDPDAFDIGDEITVEAFNPGDLLEVTSISKGKGFSGVIKRYGFARGPETHGSRYHRRVGSLGPTGPSRVFKGRKLPGRMGSDKVTIKGLEVVRVDPERNLLMIKGSVPGIKGSLVSVAVKQ